MNHDDPRDGTFHDDAFGEPVDVLDDRPGPDAEEFAAWINNCFTCQWTPWEALSYAPDHLWDYHLQCRD